MKKLIFLSTLTLLALSSCKKADEVSSGLSDAQQVEKLKDVKVTNDSTTVKLILPAGASSGKSFQQLRTEDSATYTNPANYGAEFVDFAKADNVNGDTDAKFDGMTMNIIMDTLNTLPIAATAGAFKVPAHSTAAFPLHGALNLATHKKAGLYIFKQTVAGNDLATTLYPIFNYKIGSLSGVIPLPKIQQNIPTLWDANTKAFLQGLIDSGIFNK